VVAGLLLPSESQDVAFPLVVLLLLAFSTGLLIRHWTALLVAPLGYWAFAVVSAAVDSGDAGVLLPWNWLNPSGGEDFTVVLVGLLAFVALMGWAIGRAWQDV
jgi:hypothetical protein